MLIVLRVAAVGVRGAAIQPPAALSLLTVGFATRTRILPACLLPACLPACSRLDLLPISVSADQILIRFFRSLVSESWTGSPAPNR